MSLPPLAALVAMNALPLLGVLAFGWQVGDLLAVYWLENGVIGVFTVAKLWTHAPAAGDAADRAAAASPRRPSLPARLAAGLFFALHYGAFWLAHGLLILYLVFDRSVLASVVSGAGWPAIGEGSWWAWTLAGFVVSHGLAFVDDRRRPRERRPLTLQHVMTQPYRRVVVIHVTLVVGAYLVMQVGQLLPLLLLFVGVKLVLDVRAYIEEQRAAAPSGG